MYCLQKTRNLYIQSLSPNQKKGEKTFYMVGGEKRSIFFFSNFMTEIAARKERKVYSDKIGKERKVNFVEMTKKGMCVCVYQSCTLTPFDFLPFYLKIRT